MKILLLCVLVSGLSNPSLAQAPRSSKLAAEQAFLKQLTKIIAYSKEGFPDAKHVSIKTPTLSRQGLLTFTFNYRTASDTCREVVTVPVTKVQSVFYDSFIGFELPLQSVQKIRLCNGKKPTQWQESLAHIGMVGDGEPGKAMQVELDNLLRTLQSFYK